MRKLKETKLILESWNRFIISEKNLHGVTSDQLRRIMSLDSDEEIFIFENMYGLQIEIPSQIYKRDRHTLRENIINFLTETLNAEKPEITFDSDTFILEKKSETVKKIYNYYIDKLKNFFNDDIFLESSKKVYQSMYNKIDWNDDKLIYIYFTEGDERSNSTQDIYSNLGWIMHDFVHNYDAYRGLENPPEFSNYLKKSFEIEDEVKRKVRTMNIFVPEYNFVSIEKELEDFEKIYKEEEALYLNKILVSFLLIYNAEIQKFTKGVGFKDIYASYIPLLMCIKKENIDNLDLSLHKDTAALFKNHINAKGDYFAQLTAMFYGFINVKSIGTIVEEKSIENLVNFIMKKVNENHETIKANTIKVLKAEHDKINKEGVISSFNEFIIEKYKNKLLVSYGNLL